MPTSMPSHFEAYLDFLAQECGWQRLAQVILQKIF